MGAVPMSFVLGLITDKGTMLLQISGATVHLRSLYGM